MASMWRRTMVYLGLQDDDELDTAASTSPTATTPTRPRSRERRRRGATPVGRRRRPRRRGREPGTVRTAPSPTDYGADSARPSPPAPPGPPRRDEPSGMSAPRPSVVRTIGPTTAARVHVVEPQGFNDAQEVGDRLKANQPVILNLQGLPPRAAAPPDRLLERARLRGRRARWRGSPTRSSCSRRATSRSPRRRRSGCRHAGLFQTLTVRDVLGASWSPSTSSSSAAGRSSPGSPVRGGTFLASLNRLLFDLTEPVLAPVRRVIPPVGMFDLSFMVVFFGLLILRQSVLRRRMTRRLGGPDRGGRSVATMAAMDVTPQELREQRDQGRVARLQPRRRRRPARAGRRHDRGPDAEAAGAASRPVAARRPQPRPQRRGVEVPLPSRRDDAEMLQRTLLLAQRAADDAVDEAQAQARQILDESEAKAQSLVSEAEATARRIAERERRRLEGEILELGGAPRAAARRRRRARARTRPGTATASAPRSRPTSSSLAGEVEPPVAAARDPRRRDARERARPVAIAEPDVRARRSTPRPRTRCTTSQSDQSAWDPGPDARASARSTRRPRRASASARGIRVPVARRRAASTDAGGAAPPAAEWPPPAPVAARRRPPRPRRRPTSSWLPSDDDWARRSARRGTRPRRGSATPRAHEPFASDAPIEAERRRHRLARRRRVLRARCARRSATRRRSGRVTTSQASFYDDRAEQDRRPVPPPALTPQRSTRSRSTDTRLAVARRPRVDDASATRGSDHRARRPAPRARSSRGAGARRPRRRPVAPQAHADAIGDLEARAPCAGR